AVGHPGLGLAAAPPRGQPLVPAQLRLGSAPGGADGLEARGLAGQVAQEVELRAADLVAGDDLDPRDVRARGREDALHADAGRDLADREGGAEAALLDADHGALEHLEALLVALLDADVHL